MGSLIQFPNGSQIAVQKSEAEEAEKKKLTFCIEHKGHTKQELFRCEQCQGLVCSDCVKILKKHQPCPLQLENLRREMLGPAIAKALRFPSDKYPQMYEAWRVVHVGG